MDTSENNPLRDIGPILNGWEYEAGTINVRKITGLDGKPKLQMRLDLGLLQMEMTGRPDGMRPFGKESLLDYYEGLLEQHRQKHGSDDGFHISEEQCAALRDEAVMYYHRYLSMFVLEEFADVARDTARALRVIDFCAQYAAEERDRLFLEQYRPYVTMMNIRAQASLLKSQAKYKQALETIEVGLDSIRDFFARFGQEDAFSHSNEVKVLRRFAREIRRKLPVDPLKRLQNQLDRAVQEERYEDAARFRDELAKRRAQKINAKDQG